MAPKCFFIFVLLYFLCFLRFLHFLRFFSFVLVAGAQVFFICVLFVLFYRFYVFFNVFLFRNGYGRSRSTCMQNFGLLAQKLTELHLYSSSSSSPKSSSPSKKSKFQLHPRKKKFNKKVVFLHKNNSFFGFRPKKLFLGELWPKTRKRL